VSEVHAALTRALDGARALVLGLDLDTTHRFIILSDTHKGGRDRADEFERCEPACTAALRAYCDLGFSLILLGDIEELWEQGFRKVERNYAELMRLERTFGAGRYYRVWGNHDDAWMDPLTVRSRCGARERTSRYWRPSFARRRARATPALPTAAPASRRCGHRSSGAGPSIRPARWTGRHAVREAPLTRVVLEEGPLGSFFAALP